MNTNSLGLWWSVPGVLAGMSAPFIHPERRIQSGGRLDAHADDLPLMWAAGIRAVVNLLGITSETMLYRSAGFDFLSLPIRDGSAPTEAQALNFVRFVQNQRAAEKPVLVHCAAGLGRTGTLVAVYLIASERIDASAAVRRVREVEPAAIETQAQVRFLYSFASAARPK